VPRILILALPLLTAACALCAQPHTYRMEIQQGNYITQEMIAQLKPGLTRDQVRFCAGHAPGQRHLSRGTLGLRLPAPACQQPRNRVFAALRCFSKTEKMKRVEGDIVAAASPGKARTVKLVIAGAGGPAWDAR